MLKNKKEFTFKTPDDKTITVVCAKYGISKWGHVATIIDPIELKHTSSKIDYSYSNRPYESFEYESVLYKLFKNHFRKDYDFYASQLKEISKKVSDETNEWVKSFEKKYNSCCDETKKVLANIGPIESIEQAEALDKTITTFDAMMRLLK